MSFTPALYSDPTRLGGRAMEIVYDDTELLTYMRKAMTVSDSPVLLDRFPGPGNRSGHRRGNAMVNVS